MEVLPIQRKIKRLLDRLDGSLLERKTHVRLALLALMAGHHVLLLGPPGTAKSLLARALCGCIAGASYFEYLLSKFTHPDELFGPVSIPGLKEEDYRRLTEGYLPSAHVGFLDEIFKANSAILNSLLTLINERVFHHGKHRDTVPLLGIIGASNEPPDPSGGLAALYDRFLVRIAVPPIADEDSFLRVCLGELAALDVPEEDKLTLADIQNLRTRGQKVRAGALFKRPLVAIRAQLAEHQIDASDRRWRWAVDLLKMSAVTSGRDELSPLDLVLLEHCFGDPGQNEALVRKAVREQLTRSVDNSGYFAPMEEIWATMGRMRESYAESKAARIEQLDTFDERLQQASGLLNVQLERVREQAESCPWVVDVPPELLAGFVAARRTLNQFERKSRMYRNSLDGDGPAKRLCDALRNPMRRHSYSWGYEHEAAVWVCLRQQIRDRSRWIPLDRDGDSLYTARDSCIRHISQQVTWKRQHHSDAMPGEAPDWDAFVRCIVVDDDILHALHLGTSPQVLADRLSQEAEAHRIRRLRKHGLTPDARISKEISADMQSSERALGRLFQHVSKLEKYRLPAPPGLHESSDKAEKTA